MTRSPVFLLAGLSSTAFWLPAYTLAQTSQPEHKKPESPKVLQLTVKARKPQVGAAGGLFKKMTVPFEAKEPLRLSDKPIAAEDVAGAAKRGVEYLLRQQRASGSWTYKYSQVRGKPKGIARAATFTAKSSCKPLVATALVALALKAQRSVDPDRIDKALAGATDYLVRKAGKLKSWARSKVSYSGWAAALTISYLCEAHAAAASPESKQAIRDAIQHLVKITVKSQHPGDVEVLLASMKPTPGGTMAPVCLGFGVMAEERGPETRGARALTYPMYGSRSKVRLGDRILAMDGEPIADCWDFARRLRKLKAGQTVKLEVLREGRKGRERSMTGLEPRDGGWSYMNISTASTLTSCILLALLDARGIGIDIDAGSLRRGGAVLEAMRFQDPDTGRIGYRYSNSMEKCAGLKGAVARTPLVELALHQLGRRQPEHLQAGLRTFLAYRGELDRVRGYWGTHVASHNHNAAYYYLFGHYYAARAARACGDKELAAKVGSTVKRVLITIQHDNGTWTDHDAFGQLVGSSLALLALAECAG